MSTDQDDRMLSDDDDDDDEVPLMLSRYTSARCRSIPSTTRSEPTMTSSMASSPQLPLTSDLTSTVTRTPANAAREEVPQTAEQILKKQLAAAKQDAHSEREEKLRIRRARTGERKEIVALKAGKRELYGRLDVKKAELKQKDVRIAHEQNLRAALSREHGQLVRQLEATKKNLGSGGRVLVQQANEKGGEVQNLKAEHAREMAELDRRDREIERLKGQLAREVEVHTREIEKLNAQRAKEKAELDEKAREIDKLNAELVEKQGAAAGNPTLQNLMLELQKTQASLMMPAAPPKTAERGVEMGTQTDDDGLAEKVAAVKRMLG